jgi:hypothetical protein
VQGKKLLLVLRSAQNTNKIDNVHIT